MSTQNTPSKFIAEKVWQKLQPWDRGEARKARQALVRLNLYPTRMISEDPAFNVEEANHWAALHDIVDLLNREDLRAVYQLARLLALTPEGTGEAVESQARAADFSSLVPELTKKEKTALSGAMTALLAQGG